jgi:hypothetical protein
MFTQSDLWTPAVEAEYRRVCDMRRLFEGEHEAIFVTRSGKILQFRYICENMLRALSTTMADLMLPQPPLVKVLGSDALQATVHEWLRAMGWWGQCYPTILRRSYAGYGDWKLVRGADDAHAELRLWGSEPGEFITMPRRQRVMHFWYVVTIDHGRAGKKSYRIRETHQWDDDGTEITNAAFRAEYGKIEDCTAVPWSTVTPAWPQDGQPEEGYELPGVVLPPACRVHNIDYQGNGLGDSDYHQSLVSMQEGLNITVSSRQFVIRATEEPAFAASSDLLDDDGNLDLDRAKRQVIGPDGRKSLLEIKNWQGHLPNSEFQWNKYEDVFYLLTPLTPAVNGTLSTESGYARLLALRKPSASAIRGQQALTPATLWAVQKAAELERYYTDGRGGAEPIDSLDITWPAIFPDDPNDISLRVSTATRDGNMSLETAIDELHPNKSEQWRREELERIRAAERERATLSLQNFSTNAGGE